MKICYESPSYHNIPKTTKTLSHTHSLRVGMLLSTNKISLCKEGTPIVNNFAFSPLLLPREEGATSLMRGEDCHVLLSYFSSLSTFRTRFWLSQELPMATPSWGHHVLPVTGWASLTNSRVRFLDKNPLLSQI